MPPSPACIRLPTHLFRPESVLIEGARRPPGPQARKSRPGPRPRPPRGDDAAPIYPPLPATGYVRRQSTGSDERVTDGPGLNPLTLPTTYSMACRAMADNPPYVYSISNNSNIYSSSTTGPTGGQGPRGLPISHS